MIKMLNKRLFYYVLTSLLTVAAGSASASIRVDDVQVGIEGYVRAESWIPVSFQIQSLGADFQGRIEVRRGDTVFHKSLDLSSGTGKQVDLLAYMSTYLEPMTYRVLDSRGRLVLERKLVSRMLSHQDNLILVVSDTDYNHQFVNGIQNPWGGKTFVAYRKTGQMYSEWLAYAAADAIALGSISPAEIPPERWKALVLSIASGGVLICSAATSLSVLRNPLLKSSFPHFSTDLNQISKGEFLMIRWKAVEHREFPDISIPAQTLTPLDSQTNLMKSPAEPGVVVASPYYKGNTIYFAFDYTRLPEVIRTRFAAYWNQTIFPAGPGVSPFGQPYRPRLEDNPKIQKHLHNIPGLKLPDLKWFALFFFVYLVAIGPLQYLILNHLKRNSLLWTTFPLVILIFTLLPLGYSKYRHSTDDNITQDSVLEIFPELGQETLYQTYAIVLAGTGIFDLQAYPDNSYLTRPVRRGFNYQTESFILSEDLPFTLEQVRNKSYTFRTFDAISSQPASFPIQVRATVQDRELKGSVSNNSTYSIRDSFFFYNKKNTVSLGTVGPGAKRDFTLKLTNVSYPPFAENHLRDLLDLYNLSHANAHFFLGNIPDGKGVIRINQKRINTVSNQYVAVYVQVEGRGPGINEELPR